MDATTRELHRTLGFKMRDVAARNNFEVTGVSINCLDDKALFLIGFSKGPGKFRHYSGTFEDCCKWINAFEEGVRFARM